jgi:hypothetical protein
MKVRQTASVVASLAALLLGVGARSGKYALWDHCFEAPEPVVLSQPMRTSYGTVLPAGTDGTLDLLFFDPSGTLIGLSKAQYVGGAGAPAAATGMNPRVSTAMINTKIKRTKIGQPKYEEQTGSKAQGKMSQGRDGSPTTPDSIALKNGGSPAPVGEVTSGGSKGGGKVSYQTGGSAGANHGLQLPAVQVARSAGLPAGTSLAQLGFGPGSQARFQNNAVVIITGKPGTGELKAVLAPAPR